MSENNRNSMASKANYKPRGDIYDVGEEEKELSSGDKLSSADDCARLLTKISNSEVRETIIKLISAISGE